MTFIPPKYQCDFCEKEEKAEWTGEPDWDIPVTWTEKVFCYYDKHYCKDCSKPCGCGQCGGLPSHVCALEKRQSR